MNESGENILVAKGNKCRVVIDWRGIAVLRDGKRNGVSSLEFIEAFCGEHSAAPQDERNPERLIPFLEAKVAQLLAKALTER
jgi:hypothetical protein